MPQNQTKLNLTDTIKIDGNEGIYQTTQSFINEALLYITMCKYTRKHNQR